MKNIRAAVVLLSVILNQVKAQESFHKHALIISADFGGDVYAITEKYNVNGYPNLGYTTTIGAACASYPISVEYGVGKWLGLGLVAKFDNYAIKKDSATQYQPVATGFEFGALVNFHLVRKEHLDFFLGLNLGSSSFIYTLDSHNDQLYGNGAWSDIHAGLRYYFHHFGINALLSFPNMNYNLTGNNANWSLGQDILSTWKADGVAFNVGIQYRFFD